MKKNEIVLEKHRLPGHMMTAEYLEKSGLICIRYYDLTPGGEWEQTHSSHFKLVSLQEIRNIWGKK